jgi:hypothetical protein
MSRSFHATFSQLKGKTKKELDEMSKDAKNILDELATKSSTKKNVIQNRKGKKNDNFLAVDTTMRGPMIDLAGIRKELNAIGTNINQITHAFHVAETDSQKVFHALRVAEQYRMVDDTKPSALILFFLSNV